MKIKFIEIQNFRKLKSCHIDFSDKETVFVGANNSGKTSAMDALTLFLKEKKLTTTDFTLSNWNEIDKIGKTWTEGKKDAIVELSIEKWIAYLPSIDIWIEVKNNELHYISHMIPTLDWKGGLLGVRLRYEPKNIDDDYNVIELYKDFSEAFKSAQETTAKAKLSKKDMRLNLWPKSLKDFLDKKGLNTYFTIHSYILNPKEIKDSEDGYAMPQKLPSDSTYFGVDPLKDLIKIDTINAQRGFTDPNTSDSIGKGNLSDQLRKYYSTHLNPTDSTELEDIDALQAIEEAQSSFDKRIRYSLTSALNELEELGYPGFSNPKITLSSKLNPMDSLNHESSVQYDVIRNEGTEKESVLKLPEKYNGLGYQNLISMVFELIRFRDEWMQVGKVAKKKLNKDELGIIKPLHLVLVEEPEAHLHAQVQQVFIRKAYDVLRNNMNLKEKDYFITQLVVSTHSSYIAHEIDFSTLRYFRRRRPNKCGEVPTATVVNLSNTFGKKDETTKFVERYLRTTHCDLFFADAAILIEGTAEKMLIPNFIREYFAGLTSSYISLLEIGGRHAHRLEPLIESLGIITLIITDIDSIDPSDRNIAIRPKRNAQYKTGNDTLKTWFTDNDDLDNLLKIDVQSKESKNFPIRVAYQIPVKIKYKGKDVEALPYTFEDSLVLENMEIFEKIKGKGLIKKFNEAIEKSTDIDEASDVMFEALREGKKAEFALEILFREETQKLKVPLYISEGLFWLMEKLKIKQNDLLLTDNKKCQEPKE